MNFGLPGIGFWGRESCWLSSRRELGREAPANQTARCLTDPSWRLFTATRWTMLLYDIPAPGQFWGPRLSSPRPFGVLDHNTNPKKGCLFLKMRWEPRWKGSSETPSNSLRAPHPESLPHPSCLEWNEDCDGLGGIRGMGL